MEAAAAQTADCERRRAPLWALLLTALLLGAAGLGADEVSEGQRASVPLQAVRGNSGEVSLNWAAPVGSRRILSTTIYRREFPPTTRESAWGEPLAVLTERETQCADTLREGSRGFVEYRVVNLETDGGRTAYGYAVVNAGSRDGSAVLDERKGVLVLVAENIAKEPVPGNAARLAEKLGAEGWTANLEQVPMDEPAEAVKTRVRNCAEVMRKQGVTLQSLLLLGHVAVPYSGNFAPDGHMDHWGAWPTDLYYGDLDGCWPDERDFPARARDPRQHNVAGDGKLDLNELPGRVELSVGRVDFSRLEEGNPDKLVQRTAAWLRRAIAWHEGQYPATGGQVLLHDLMPEQAEAFATTPWRLAPLLTAPGTEPAQPVRVPLMARPVTAGAPLFAFGYAPGMYTWAMGLADSGELLERGIGVPFVFLFGSYFGDWDAPGNLLQAALASPEGGALSSAWAARPAWQLHPLAAGFTLGDCQVLTANRTQDYLPGLREAYPIHLALLGDPTMHLYPLPGAEAPRVSVKAGGQFQLEWDAPGLDAPPRPPALAVEAVGWHVFSLAGGGDGVVPTRLTQSALAFNRHEFSWEVAAGEAPRGFQVRPLYRVRTPQGVLERLGPGQVHVLPQP